MENLKKLIYLSLLVACGMVLHFVESTIPVPFPVPGAKLGLANIIALLAITMYGTKEALFVNILRCLLGTLLGGTMSSLIYSLSGAITSTLVMAVFYRYFRRTFSLVGISIIGGVAHNIAQITVASLVISNFGIFVYLPFLMIIGLLTGTFTGMTAFFINKNILAIKANLRFLGRKA